MGNHMCGDYLPSGSLPTKFFFLRVISATWWKKRPGRQRRNIYKVKLLNCLRSIYWAHSSESVRSLILWDFNIPNISVVCSKNSKGVLRTSFVIRRWVESYKSGEDAEKSDSSWSYRIFLCDRKVSACRGLSPSRSDCFLLAERGMSESWPRWTSRRWSFPGGFVSFFSDSRF